MKIVTANKKRRIIGAVFGALLIMTVLFFTLPAATSTTQVQACGIYSNPQPSGHNWWDSWWNVSWWFGGHDDGHNSGGGNGCRR